MVKGLCEDKQVLSIWLTRETRQELINNEEPNKYTVITGYCIHKAMGISKNTPCCYQWMNNGMLLEC